MYRVIAFFLWFIAENLFGCIRDFFQFQCFTNSKHVLLVNFYEVLSLVVNC